MPVNGGFDSANMLSHDMIPLVNNMHDMTSLQLQPQNSSKQQTFGRQAQLSQKFRASHTHGINSGKQDSINNPTIFSLKQSQCLPNGEPDLQSTSHFQTIQ